MHHRQEHVTIAVDKTHFPLARHFNLIQVHLEDLCAVLHWHVGWFATHDVKDLDQLWVRWVNHGENISAQGDVSLIQKLYSEALVFRRGDKLALIRIDIEILTCINQSEIFGTLDDEEDDVLDVENEWRAPVHRTIDVALGCGTHD